MQPTYTLPEQYFNEANKITNVSRETFCLLENFVNLLLKWNKSINLVSKAHSTPGDVWKRHILDSIQLASYIPQEAKVITDFGSGGGFPGIILALMGNWEVHLIESDQRKCAFLIEASRVLSRKIYIHNDRIERLEAWESDVLTARALAPLDKLLELTNKFYKTNQLCLFLKGQNMVEEIDKASISWNIDYKVYPSMTSEDGKILQISNVTSRRMI
jgi:16S rRNA (guanine527-N7)-methyltransferase